MAELTIQPHPLHSTNRCPCTCEPGILDYAVRVLVLKKMSHPNERGSAVTEHCSCEITI